MKIFDFNKLTETVTAYIETRIELLKLDLRQQVVHYLAKSLTKGLIAISVLIGLLLLTLGASALINEFLDSNYLGFVIMASAYLLFALIVFLKKEAVEKKIEREISKSEILGELVDNDE